MSSLASSQSLVGGVTQSLVSTATAQAVSTSLGSLAQNLDAVKNSIVPQSFIKVARTTGEQIATASDSYVQATITEAISEATLSVSELNKLRDFYGYKLSLGGNVAYLCLACILLVFFIAMSFRSRYQMFNVCFIGAFGFESLGYLGRVFAVSDPSQATYLALQGIRLFMVPQCLFAGICMVFSQIVCVHGQKYSSLSPLRMFYLFVGLNWFSISVAAIGGPLAPHIMGLEVSKSFDVGMSFMFAGDVLNAMVLLCFTVFCHIFSYNAFFSDRHIISNDSIYTSPGVITYLKMQFNVRSARLYKTESLDRFYSPRYQGIRSRPLFYYYPLVVVVAATLLLIRCLYRAIYTKMGYGSYLDTHEIFLFLIETPSIILVGLLFVPFHPYFVFGRENVLRVVDLGQEEFAGAEKEKEESFERPSERSRCRFDLPAAFKPYTAQDRNEVLYID